MEANFNPVINEIVQWSSFFRVMLLDQLYCPLLYFIVWIMFWGAVSRIFWAFRWFGSND